MHSGDKKHVVNSAITIVLGSIFLVIPCVMLFRSPIAEYGLQDINHSTLVICMGFISAFDLLSNLPNYYFRADEKPKTFTFYKILRFIIEFFGIIIGVKVLEMGALGAVLGILAASVVNFLIFTPFYFRFFKFEFNKALIKEMLYYGLPLLPNAILYLIIETSDRYFLEGIVNKETQVIYSNIYKFGGILTIINSSFRAAWQPLMLREVTENNNKQFFAKVMTYFVVFSSVIMIFISLLALDFIHYNPIEFFQKLIKDPIYYQAQHILGFILLGYVFLGIYYNLSLAYYVTKKSINMMMFTLAGFFVNIGLNCFIFIRPENGTTIASFATFMAFFTMSVLSYKASKRLFPVQYEMSKLVKMMIYMFLVALVVTFYGELSFLVKLFIALGYIPYLFIMKIISMNDVRQIKQLVRR